MIPLWLIPIALLVAAWQYGVFDIHEIALRGGVRTDEAALSEKLDSVFLGRLIFEVSSREIELEVLDSKEFPYIDKITIEKVLPDKVVVGLTEKVPYVCLLGLGTVDSAGSVILEEECDTSVPSLILEADEVNVDQVGAALIIKAALTQAYFPVSAVTLMNYGDILITSGNLQCWFSISSTHTIDSQVALVLQIYASDLNRDGTLIKIDVRFDKAYTERAK